MQETPLYITAASSEARSVSMETLRPGPPGKSCVIMQLEFLHNQDVNLPQVLLHVFLSSVPLVPRDNICRLRNAGTAHTQTQQQQEGPV